MRVKTFLLFLAAISLPGLSSAYIGPTYVAGSITNITSITGSFLIRIGASENPQNCTGNVQYGWMQINEDDKSIMALTLTAWTLGRTVTVYTSATSSGYCQVIQVDPAES